MTFPIEAIGRLTVEAMPGPSRRWSLGSLGDLALTKRHALPPQPAARVGARAGAAGLNARACRANRSRIAPVPIAAASVSSLWARTPHTGHEHSPARSRLILVRRCGAAVGAVVKRHMVLVRNERR